MTTDITKQHTDVATDPDGAPFDFDTEAGPDDEIDLEDDTDSDTDSDIDADDETDDEIDTGIDTEIDADDAVGPEGGDIAVGLVVVDPAIAAGPALAATPATADSDPDDDVLIVDEVEASLDIILAERMRAGDADSEDEPDDDEVDDTPSQLATVIPVRRPEEFLCQSCFLLKPPGQLADIDHQLCRDCA